MTSKIWKGYTPEFKRFWKYCTGFYAVWIAHIGRKMGLLDELRSHPSSAISLAARKRFSAPVVMAWCSGASYFGYLREQNGKLYVTKETATLLLTPSHEQFLGGLFSYLAVRSLDFEDLEKPFLKDETAHMKSVSINAVEEATTWEHYAFLNAVKGDKKLHSLLGLGGRLLDVGCGTGGLLFKLHNRYPKATLVGLERNQGSVEKSERMRTGSKSIRVIKGDAEHMKFMNEFDIIYFGESLYSMIDKSAVMRNCFRALKTTGIVAIIEGLLPEFELYSNSRSTHNEEKKLIMAMQLDFALQGCDFLKRSALTTLLDQSGFTNIKFRDLGGMVFLITARK